MCPCYQQVLVVQTWENKACKSVDFVFWPQQNKIEEENKYKMKKKPTVLTDINILFCGCHPGLKITSVWTKGETDRFEKGRVKRLNWSERGEMLGHMVWWEIPHWARSPAQWLDEMSYLPAAGLCPLSRAREKSLSSQPASQLIRVPFDLYHCCHRHMPNFRLC